MSELVKTIAAVLNAPAPHMVGDAFRVHNFFPNGYEINMDPFYLLDYNSKINFSARNRPRGVGVHPHRGFETVTIVYHGSLAHEDSAGNTGVIHPGDVQWMSAARGILHKEFHEKNFSLRGGEFQIVQLWVNLPAKDKMSAPKYQSLKNEDLKKYFLPNNGGYVEIIAGTFKNVDGAASTFSPLEVYNIRLKKGAKITLSLPEHYNTGLLAIHGQLMINEDRQAAADQFVHFTHVGTVIKIEALYDSLILLLSGAPINEPIAAYGPFVMNKPEEITQAITDYNEGRFGFLE